MDVTTLSQMTSGAIFGAALTAAGVYVPIVIVGQMQLNDFHMLKAFMVASATSALAIYASNKLQITHTKPRMPSSAKLFSIYDRNLIGGTILGCGMTLTGACPGTVIPQVATGIPTGPFVMFGGLLGGIIFSRYATYLPRQGSDLKALEKPTLHEKLGSSAEVGLLLYETLCIGLVAGVSFWIPADYFSLLHPVVGGLVIGISQVASLLLTKGTLGVSGAYEQVGDIFWWYISPSNTQKKPRPNTKALLFVAGSLLGSYGLGLLVQIPAPSVALHISNIRAVMGGVMLIIGARIAGGCTSGHGISGLSQLSTASIISVAAMFGGGIGLSAVMKLCGQ